MHYENNMEINNNKNKEKHETCITWEIDLTKRKYRKLINTRNWGKHGVIDCYAEVL